MLALATVVKNNAADALKNRREEAVMLKGNTLEGDEKMI